MKSSSIAIPNFINGLPCHVVGNLERKVPFSHYENPTWMMQKRTRPTTICVK